MYLYIGYLLRCRAKIGIKVKEIANDIIVHSLNWIDQSIIFVIFKMQNMEVFLLDFWGLTDEKVDKKYFLTLFQTCFFQ